MQQIVTVKLTPAEVEILDWLMHRRDLESRSQAIRSALREVVERLGVNRASLDQLREERTNHLPRRSPKVARLIGRRQRNNREADKIT